MKPDNPPKEYLEQATRILDTVSTWLAVANIGSLAFLYNAILVGHIRFEGPVRLLACLFIGGAVNAFMFKVLSAMEFLRGRWPYSLSLPWLALIGAGFGLLCGLFAPLLYPSMTPH